MGRDTSIRTRWILPGRPLARLMFVLARVGLNAMSRQQSPPTSASSTMRCSGMSLSTSPLFADAVIDCMGEARTPTLEELMIVAQRIWSDGAASRSAFSWGELSASSSDRLGSMRAAGLALHGSG